MFGHFVADFVLQRDSWAKAKSTSNLALTKHVATYTAAIFLFALAVLPLVEAIAFALIQGITHWMIDYVTSRQTSRFYKKQQNHNFFVVIGFDQWLHVTVMLLTLIGLGYN